MQGLIAAQHSALGLAKRLTVIRVLQRGFAAMVAAAGAMQGCREDRELQEQGWASSDLPRTDPREGRGQGVLMMRALSSVFACALL